MARYGAAVTAVRRSLPIGLVLSVLTVVAGCGGGTSSPGATASPAATDLRGSRLSPPTHAADFALRDQDGRVVRLSEQRGRFVVIAFLYTHCPDVCPLIAQNLNTALRRLGSKRQAVRVLAVSVDPRGDTPVAVRRYVARHRLLPEFRYLIGRRRQLGRVWRDYHIDVQPGKLDTVGHSAYELLVDREGRGRVLYDSGVRANDVVHDVRALANV